MADEATMSYDEWQAYRKARNVCPTCGPDTKAQMKNYDGMWGDADLWCLNCDKLIRVMDFG